MLSVQRDARVNTNAPLLALERENEKATRDEATARLSRAEPPRDNLRKGKRPDELASIRAQLAQSDASLK